MPSILLIGAAIALCSTPAAAATVSDAEGNLITIDDTSRIVTLGGSITEIAYVLGFGDRIVGVDASSAYPAEVDQLPKVAYHRRLSAEGVLSLAPALIIATTEAGPPEALQQLRSAGVTVLILPHEPTVACAITKIERIATALDAEAAGASLVARLQDELHQAQSAHPSDKAKAKILFLYARGQGTLMVAGQDTGADTMIGLAGGLNAVQGYSGYKPLTSEAAVAATPDAILLMDSGLESIGGPDGLWQLPGLNLTPAGQQRRVLSMNGLLLLGFGPRLGQAALSLHQSLYPTPPKTATNDERN